MERRGVRRAAFTLIEVLLAATLTLLAFGLLTQILVPMLRYFAWTSARSELLQAASLAARYLVGDLQRAPMEGITLPAAGSPGLLAVHGVVGVTDTGLAVYSDQLIAYEWKSATGNLVRKLWPPPASAGPPVTAGAPVRLAPSQMRAIMDQVNGTERTLVRGLVKDFQLSTGVGVSTLPLHLRLVVEIDVAGRGRETYEHSQDIYLRNGS